jgi:hypothetical protein
LMSCLVISQTHVESSSGGLYKMSLNMVEYFFSWYRFPLRAPENMAPGVRWNLNGPEDNYDLSSCASKCKPFQLRARISGHAFQNASRCNRGPWSRVNTRSHIVLNLSQLIQCGKLQVRVDHRGCVNLSALIISPLRSAPEHIDGSKFHFISFPET